MSHTQKASRSASPSRRWLACREAAIAVVKSSRHMPLEDVSLDDCKERAESKAAAVQRAKQWVRDVRRSVKRATTVERETNGRKSAATTTADHERRLEKLARQAATVIFAPVALAALLRKRLRVEDYRDCFGPIVALQDAVFGGWKKGDLTKQLKIARAALKKPENFQAAQAVARALLRKSQLSAVELKRLICDAKRRSRGSRSLAA